MPETCIVCLGDLGSGANEDHRTSDNETKAAERGATITSHQLSPDKTTNSDYAADFIAHLLPCGHNLHNECLKPWVERANSCPICRQSFNKVELSTVVGGMSFHFVKYLSLSLTFII